MYRKPLFCTLNKNEKTNETNSYFYATCWNRISASNCPSAFEEINTNPALSAGKYYATRHQRQNLPQFLRDILHSIFPHLHVTAHDISQRKRNTIAR